MTQKAPDTPPFLDSPARPVPRLGLLSPVAGRTLLLLLLALLGSLVVAQKVQLSDDVYDVAKLLRCPVCQAESVADSNSEISISMRQEIAQQLAAGKSREEILDYFEARYGPWILMNPPKRGLQLLVWLLPLAAGLAALAALIWFVRRWTRQAQVPVEAGTEELERVRRELKGER